MERSFARIFTIASICAVLMPAQMVNQQAIAASMEAVQGAWTMNGTECSATFENRGGRVHFRDRAASVTTGIIVEGNKVVGPNAVCKTQKIRSTKDGFSASLSCGDAIMFSSVSVSFRIVDGKTIERFDPQFPEEFVRYHRCAP